MSSEPDPAPLYDAPIHPRFKLAALWTSVMFLYVYGDIFTFFRAEMLRDLLAGRTPVGPTTEGALLFFSAMMAIPSLMVCLSIFLRPTLCRWLNIVAGATYSIIIVLTASQSWLFGMFLGVIEFAVTVTVVWVAVKWPRRPPG